MGDLGKYATVRMEIFENDIPWLCWEWEYVLIIIVVDEEKLNNCPSHIGKWKMNLPGLSFIVTGLFVCKGIKQGYWIYGIFIKIELLEYYKKEEMQKG